MLSPVRRDLHVGVPQGQRTEASPNHLLQSVKELLNEVKSLRNSSRFTEEMT